MPRSLGTEGERLTELRRKVYSNRDESATRRGRTSGVALAERAWSSAAWARHAQDVWT